MTISSHLRLIFLRCCHHFAIPDGAEFPSDHNQKQTPESTWPTEINSARKTALGAAPDVLMTGRLGRQIRHQLMAHTRLLRLLPHHREKKSHNKGSTRTSELSQKLLYKSTLRTEIFLYRLHAVLKRRVKAAKMTIRMTARSFQLWRSHEHTTM